MNSERLVETEAELSATCERFARSGRVAVDTEFFRERTYRAELCLVQLAVEGEHALIDPQAVPELGPLRRLLLDEKVLKVFHSGRQDLEIFFQHFGEVPGPLFDTQVAAALLGLGDNLGYARLVDEVLGVELPPSRTRTDWRRRPLSSSQLAYAAADVTHLLVAQERLAQDLRDRGRSAWHEEEALALGCPELYRVPPETAWKGVKGGARLKPSEGAILRELAAWREEEAEARDRPRRWILADAALLELARRAPQSTAELKSLAELPEASARRHGSRLLALVARGLERADGQEDRGEGRPPRPTREQRALTESLGALVKLRAQEAGLPPSLLAPRADLEALALEGEVAGLPLLAGWRRELVGEDLLSLRAGRSRLLVVDGALRLLPADAGAEPR